MTRQRRRTLEKALTPYRKTPGTKSKKRERPVVFEVDLDQALTELFSTKRHTVSGCLINDHLVLHTACLPVPAT